MSRNPNDTNRFLQTKHRRVPIFHQAETKLLVSKVGRRCNCSQILVVLGKFTCTNLCNPGNLFTPPSPSAFFWRKGAWLCRARHFYIYILSASNNLLAEAYQLSTAIEAKTTRIKNLSRSSFPSSKTRRRPRSLLADNSKLKHKY